MTNGHTRVGRQKTQIGSWKKFGCQFVMVAKRLGDTMVAVSMIAKNT